MANTAQVCRASDLHVALASDVDDRALGYAEASHRVTGIMAGGWGENIAYLRGVEQKLTDTLNRVREALGSAETRKYLAEQE